MTQWDPQQIPDLSGKVALVTGCNSGIGLETARTLAAKGAVVVLACKTDAMTEAAEASIRASVPQARLEPLQIDLSDLESVREAATRFRARRASLDILCNNAGTMGHHTVQRSAQGFELQFATNYLGHFALTGLLFDLLQAAPAARVVMVSSVAHKMTKGLNLDDPGFEQGGYNHFDAYGKSKLACLSFALELNRRAVRAGLGVRACAVHPGYASTNITSGANQDRNFIKDLAIRLGNAVFGMSPVRGALPSLVAATANGIEGGEFIGPDGLFALWGRPARAEPAPVAQDSQLAAALWKKSEEWTRVRFL